MATKHDTISTFLGRVASGIEDLLKKAGLDGASASWTDDQPENSADDLLWWSCGLGIEPGGRVFAGAPRETWEELGRAYESA
jgi:hypothetical protein